jgi:hypothetical protein
MPMKKSRKKPKKPRNMVVVGMLLSHRGGVMRDRRMRRPRDEERRRLTEDREES